MREGVTMDIVSKSLGSQARNARIIAERGIGDVGNVGEGEEEYVPRSRSPRLQVRVSPIVKKGLEPLFLERRGQSKLLSVAEEMGGKEALKLLAEEPRVQGEFSTVWCYPTRKLVARANEVYLSPHILVRAAAVKLYQEIQMGMPV